MLNTEQVKSSTTPIRVAKKNGNQERDGIAQSQLRRRLSRSFLSGQYLSLLVGRRYNRPLGLFSISPMVALERPIHSTCRLRTIGPDSQRVQSVYRSSRDRVHGASSVGNHSESFTSPNRKWHTCHPCPDPLRRSSQLYSLELMR